MKPLMRKHSETMKEDLRSSAGYRCALLVEAFDSMVNSDFETGKAVLRQYIKGTLGFIALGKALGKSPKSLMRMLDPQRNPNAQNLLDMIAYLQKVEGGHLRLHFVHDSGAAA